MPRAIPVPVRQILLARHQQGQSAARIAEDLDLPASTVRSLLPRLLAAPDNLAPSYSTARSTPSLLQAALDYRRQRPGWGAGLICCHLRRDHRKEDVPTPRPVQRWLRRAGLSPAPPGRKPTTRRRRSDAPHAVWE